MLKSIITNFSLSFILMPLPTTGDRGIMFTGHTFGLPSFRGPSVNNYFAWRDIFVLSGGITVTLATNMRHMSGHCWKGFQGQRSKVKGQRSRSWPD